MREAELAAKVLEAHGSATHQHRHGALLRASEIAACDLGIQGPPQECGDGLQVAVERFGESVHWELRLAS